MAALLFCPILLWACQSGPRDGSSTGLPPLVGLGEFVTAQTASRNAEARNRPDAAPAVAPGPFAQEPWANRIPLFADPSDGVFTSDFGWRGLSGRNNFHTGLDISSPAGTPLISPVSGTVVVAVSDGANSHLLVNARGLMVAFYHLQPSPSLQPGDSLRKGQAMGVQSSRRYVHLAVHYHPTFDYSTIGRHDSIDPDYAFNQARWFD